MIRSVLIYGVAGLVPQLCAYLLLPILSHSLTPGQFGVISLLEAIVFVSSAFLSLSIERGAQRFFYDFRSQDGNRVFSNALSMLLALTAIGVSLTFIADSVGLSIRALPARGLPAMAFAGGGLAVSSLALVYCQVIGRPTKYLMLQAAKGLTLLLSGYVAVGYLNLGVQGYVISVIASYTAVGAVGVFFLPRLEIRRVDRTLISGMLRFSLPFLPTVLGGWLVSISGRFFLERYATLHDVGVYAFWYKLSLAYFLCSTAINTALGPVVYQTLTSDRTGRLLEHDLLPSLVRIYGIGAIGFILIVREIGATMGGAGYGLSIALFSIIIAGHFLSSVMGGGSDLLLGYFKLTTLQMTFFIAGGVLSLGLNFLVTPRIGIYGVITATVASLLAICTSHWVLLRRRGLPNFRLAEVIAWAAAIACTGKITLWAGGYSSPLGMTMRYAVALGGIAYAVSLALRFKDVEREPELHPSLAQ